MNEHVIALTRCLCCWVERLPSVRSHASISYPSDEWLHGPEHDGQNV